MNILVTGGAGFIGLNYVKYLLFNTKHSVAVIDKLTYAGDRAGLEATGVEWAEVDIADRVKVEEYFLSKNFDIIVHFAAESHVDNSIQDCMPFVRSNIIGTINLLDMAVKHKVGIFMHISTDEVFGSIPEGKFHEGSQIDPRNPYSASKASAEHFVRAYGNTYGLNYLIVNSSNNYGPGQHREKLIPMTISRILAGQQIPVYGNGMQVRDWIYVGDTCDILYKIMCRGSTGSRYCIGGDCEVHNIEIVKMLLDKLGGSLDLIKYVGDRPGHDIRYSTDISKVELEFGWKPRTTLSAGLNLTIEWYKNEHKKRAS